MQYIVCVVAVTYLSHSLFVCREMRVFFFFCVNNYSAALYSCLNFFMCFSCVILFFSGISSLFSLADEQKYMCTSIARLSRVIGSSRNNSIIHLFLFHFLPIWDYLERSLLFISVLSPSLTWYMLFLFVRVSVSKYQGKNNVHTTVVTKTCTDCQSNSSQLAKTANEPKVYFFLLVHFFYFNVEPFHTGKNILYISGK